MITTKLEWEELAECNKAMGDKTRLRMLALLKTEDLCVCELVEILGMTQPAVSQHMRKLKNVKLVKERRQGQWVIYSLDGERLPYFRSVVDSLPDLSHEIKALKASGKKVVCE
ncbi:ArsR/SmtB family transcription factor [Desmospora profundinema]|uniref:ArsR family transcriptional regulator n=1 Tax=Desmospora profundinema TaxID=1571184 RepID=A0ABU1II23_9BACL|nr:metalloregulator ArsR/SmtB family transcription factor [Desmospora profundinema]MDR6224420.1 ArsR family transcriptional regulator [Desmospora profundinema]